jgi:hypothetical protein
MAWHWRRCQSLVWNQFVARSTQATTPSSDASSKNKTGGTRDVWVGAIGERHATHRFAARTGYDESFACGLTITRGGLVGATVVDFIQNAVAERVNQTRLVAVSAVLTPDLALDVQRGSIPGQPGAKGPKAMTNEGARWAKPPRGTAASADRYPRRMTGRQFDRVWHHWRLSSQGFGAIARPLFVIAILSALVPVDVRSHELEPARSDRK